MGQKLGGMGHLVGALESFRAEEASHMVLSTSSLGRWARCLLGGDTEELVKGQEDQSDLELLSCRAVTSLQAESLCRQWHLNCGS